MSTAFNKYFIKRTLIIALVFIGALIAAWLGFRNYVLHKALSSLETKFKEKYHSDLSVQQASFNSFAGVSLIGINIVPEDKDTLLTSDTLIITPSLTALLTGHIKLNSVFASTAKIYLFKSDSTTNYDIFLHSSRNAEDTVPTTRNYAALFNKLLKNVFYYLPSDMNLEQIELSSLVNGKKERTVTSFSKHRNIVQASMEDIVKHKTWKMEGDVERSDKTFSLKLYGVDEKRDGRWKMGDGRQQREIKYLPLIEAFTNSKLNFDTLFLSLHENTMRSNRLNLSGKVVANGMHLENEKISQDEVLFNDLSYNYHFTISDHAIVADSSDELQIDDITAHAGLSYLNADHKEYGIDLKTDVVPASDFFASLPQGMFNNFDQMKADGTLQYTFHFKFNPEEPDSLEFISSLLKDKFHISKYGVTNFSMLNGDFIYTAYEHDKPFRTINISTSNPDFIPLQYIPSCFKNAVLTSEDGSFFYHNGFNEDAFKKSIVADYKAGKFVRGGSTITMQLVKNVFLSRHKTIARKAEEALIVWLIESNHIVSKERMMEIYLNIIELGPNVYGVNEAAKFYFNKNATELTLPESIFLASLLPRPKWFKYSFDQNGILKPYFADYFRVVSNFMLKKNLITQDEYDHLKPEITLKGPAKNAVMPTDSVPPTMEEEEE